MTYDPSPEIRALMNSCSADLRAADAEGLERYIYLRILRHSELRPLSWREFITDRPDQLRPVALVYDRPAGLVFVGGHATHEKLGAQLYHLRSLDASAAGRFDEIYFSQLQRFEREADAFITEGMGMRMGSSSAQMGRRTLVLGKNVRLTPREYAAFADYKLDRI